MSKVFISYSRKDLKFVEQLATDLTDAGLDVWYDLSGLKGGDQWTEKIQEAINTCEKFILVLSPDSLKSKWVLREFLYASNLDITIIPLLHKMCALPLWLQDIHLLDIQGTKYQANFKEILAALGEKTANAKKKVDPKRLESEAIKYELLGDLWNAREVWYEIKRLDPLFPRADIKIQELENELAVEKRRAAAKGQYKRSRVPVSILVAILGLAFLLLYPNSPMALIPPTATPTPTFTQTPTQTPTATRTAPATFTPTQAFTKTPTPTETRLPSPTFSTTPDPFADGFELIAIDEVVYRGGEAHAEIRTYPDTYCTLTFFLPSGTMSAVAGTGACTTDADGVCKWTWDIRSNVNPGYGNVVIIVGEQQESYPIKVE